MLLGKEFAASPERFFLSDSSTFTLDIQTCRLESSTSSPTLER